MIALYTYEQDHAVFHSFSECMTQQILIIFYLNTQIRILE